jgi:hypothetical protein
VKLSTVHCRKSNHNLNFNFLGILICRVEVRVHLLSVLNPIAGSRFREIVGGEIWAGKYVPSSRALYLAVRTFFGSSIQKTSKNGRAWRVVCHWERRHRCFLGELYCKTSMIFEQLK